MLFTVGLHGTPHGIASSPPHGSPIAPSAAKHDSRFTDKNICVCVILFTATAVIFLFVSHTLKYLIDIQLLRAGFQSQARSNLKRQLVHQRLALCLRIEAQWQASPPFAISDISRSVPSQCVWHIWLQWLSLAKKRPNTISMNYHLHDYRRASKQRQRPTNGFSNCSIQSLYTSAKAMQNKGINIKSQTAPPPS